jgi:OmpA-OmpF porin, OOP family
MPTHRLSPLLVPLLLMGAHAASEPLTFRDSRGNKIVFPHGRASFADALVSYRPGSPAPGKATQQGKTALGVPDYTGQHADGSDYVCLGHGGSLTVRFDDNALVDVKGPDLYVFEIGPDVEATLVEISEDGRKWISVGRAAGSLSSVDIGPHSKPSQVFRFVRLTDDPKQGDGGGTWPGADIDAVGAIGSAIRLSLSSEVLFEFDRAELKPAAKSVLDRIASSILKNRGMVTVEGHTDNQGTATYNANLSRKRAEAVANYLLTRGVPKERLKVASYGETRPVASNDAEAGRQRNRRVELVIRL